MLKTRVPKGFTLLELMVVISLIAIMAAFTIPTITKPMANERLLAMANRAAGWIYQTRSLSMGLKRCTRIQGYDVANAVSAMGLPIRRVRLLELGNADCETGSWIGNAGTTTAAMGNYRQTVLRDMIPDPGFTITILPDTGGVSPMWRPTGFLRGNGDAVFANDGFRLRINRGADYVMVGVTMFGQICTGDINAPSPPC